jgi:predicted O-methyltransferase YrrM
MFGWDATWDAVEDYFGGQLVEEDAALRAARESAAEAGLPQHELTPAEGKLLHLLARATNARTILEIGALTGYSTIWLARALPEGGRLVTIERDPRAAEVARANVERAGLRSVELLEGDARELLSRVEGPFDLVFIDADKRSNPVYLDHAIRLAKPGTLIVADNVVRGGAVADPATQDPDVRGVQTFTERLAADPRVTATAIQTVGTKGHDGFVVGLVTSPRRSAARG